MKYIMKYPSEARFEALKCGVLLEHQRMSLHLSRRSSSFLSFSPFRSLTEVTCEKKNEAKSIERAECQAMPGHFLLPL